MLGTFKRYGRALETVEVAEGPTLSDPRIPEEIVWLDLHGPTTEEKRFVERGLGIEVPTREEMREIEASSRVYEEGEALYLTLTVPVNADEPPPTSTEITFIIKGDRLVTLRYAEPRPFRGMSARLERQGALLPSGLTVFFWLVDAIIARLADVLERATADLDHLSHEIFDSAAGKSGKPGDERERPDLVEALSRIGRNGDTASKIRDSLLTLQRILLVVGVTERVPAVARKDARQRARALNRDVGSLIDHCGFLSSKINLLLDATLGLINIEQTNIIKIFSVLAIVFLPPTLIASIYGMNFAVMPELRWGWGYPFAILLMVLSAILPYLFFRHRRWL
jgi:magnesium transporter